MDQENTLSPNSPKPENANGDLTSSAPAPETARPEGDADEMGELIKEFLVESYENLDQLDRDLVALEKDPSSQATLASIFRTIHTIKGTCGFFGYAKLESVTHVGENLLSRLRDGKLHLTSEIATTLLKMVDAVRQMLGSIESERQEGDVDYSQLIAKCARRSRIGRRSLASRRSRSHSRRRP
jgi:chemotaxis protein histidine kinase CheA